jgi:retinol-binding protein 3
MSTVTRALAAASVVVLGATAPVFPAQPPASQGPDMSIDESTRVAVIDGVVQQLADFYVYPDAATKMGQAIRQHQQQHRYDAITSARTFAETLTSDLREVSHDRHLALNYSFSILPTFPFPPPTPTPDQVERQRAAWSQRNFGFEKVERLAGNIG